MVSGRGSCPAVGLSSQSRPIVVELTVARAVSPIAAWYGERQPPRFTPLLRCSGSPGICAVLAGPRSGGSGRQPTGLAYRSVLSLHGALRTTVLPTLHCRYSAPHSLRTQIPAGSSRAIRHVTSATHAREAKAKALQYMNQYLNLTERHRHCHCHCHSHTKPPPNRHPTPAEPPA